MLLILASLIATPSIKFAIEQSIEAARREPTFSAFVDVGISGVDLLDGGRWQVVRRSKDWAEIDISPSPNPRLGSGAYELKNGVLTVYRVRERVFSRAVVGQRGDALAQLYEIFESKEADWGTIGPICSSEAMRAFLTPFESAKLWKREVERDQVSYTTISPFSSHPLFKRYVSNTQAEAAEVNSLVFDRQTGRLVGWETGPIEDLHADTYAVSYTFAPAAATPDLKLPTDAKRVDDVGRITR